MKVTSSRKDEVLKRKAEYDAKQEAYREADAKYYRERTQCEAGALQPAVDAIKQKMSEFDLLTIDVIGDRRWGGFTIQVRCDENHRNEDTTSLRWNFEATYDEDTGEVKRETGSWSGLQAVTDNQIRSLRQSVEALEYLHDFDFEKYLKIDTDKLYEGLERPEHVPNESFSDELKLAELEDLVGTHNVIKVEPFEGSYYYGSNYILVDRLTAKQAYIVEIPRNLVENETALDENKMARLKGYVNSEPRRVRMSTLNFVTPTTIEELPEEAWS